MDGLVGEVSFKWKFNFQNNYDLKLLLGFRLSNLREYYNMLYKDIYGTHTYIIYVCLYAMTVEDFKLREFGFTLLRKLPELRGLQ